MKRIIALLLVIVSLLCVFTGCNKKQTDNTDVATVDEIATTSTPDETIAETTASKATEPEEEKLNYDKDTSPLPDHNNVCDEYKRLIYKLIKETISYSEDPYNTDAVYGENPLLYYYMAIGYPGPAEILNNTSYCYKDINNDAVPELLLCTSDVVIGMYTYYKGKPTLLCNSWNRSRYYILSDGRVYNEGSNGAASHGYSIEYLPERGGKLLSEVDYLREYISENLIEIHKNGVLIERTSNRSKFESIIQGYENKIVTYKGSKLSTIYTYKEPVEEKPTIPTEPENEGAIIKGASKTTAEQLGIDTSSAEIYFGDDGTYSGYYVFWTEDDIRELRITRQEDNWESETLHTIDNFSESDPIILEASLNANYVYGFEYADANGNLYKKTISVRNMGAEDHYMLHIY